MQARKAKRFDRPIKPLDKHSLPTRLYFFDTETTPTMDDNGIEHQIFKLGVSKFIIRDKDQNIKHSEIEIFHNSLDLLTHIESKLERKQKLVVFAHNIAFDLMVLNIFNIWHEQKIKLNPPIQSGMRFLWKVNHPKGMIEFINVGNYVPFALSKIGSDLGFPKLDIDFDSATDDELITYCLRDVEIIERFIIELMTFLKDNELGAFKSTIASQALSVYRTRFMKNEITLHSNLYINTIERDAYTGGRTECFFIGNVPENKIYCLDINSMYPYVMKQGFLPSLYRGVTHENNTKLIEQILENNYVIADVLVNTTKPFHGIKYNPNLYKILETDNTPKGMKLIFPNGTFRTYLHHDELVYALKNGFIAHVYKLILYKPDDLFSEYVDFFVEMKTKATIEDNQTHRLMSKLFLNSLYGKFGQLYHDMMIIQKNYKEPYKIMNVFNMNTGLTYTDFEWFNDLWREYTNGESTFSFPAIAGAITARARMLLWNYIEYVGRENVYYCDTDSIYINEVGYNKIIHDIDETRLGAMKLEGIHNELVIYGAKNYIKDGKRIVKGVPKSAMWLNDTVSLSTRFEGWKEYRNSGMDRAPLTWTQLKINTLPYDKGIVQNDGYVKPYHIIQNLSIE